MYGGIEAGGTKFIFAVCDDNMNIIERRSIPTTTPDETFKEVFKLFDKYDLKAIGIGSFGPIDVNKQSNTYGYIKSTPKLIWKNTDFLGVFKKRYDIPIGWTTDVNIAALAEYKLGTAKGKDSCVYITVGTGIGGGSIINGKFLGGINHPEMGHFYPPRHGKDNYKGICDYHEDCLEGLASGPAIEARFGKSAKELNQDHEAWDIQAHYLAHAALTYTTILRPDCIIFGGGVMNQNHLLDKIHNKFENILSDYLEISSIKDYILSTGLGNDSGIIGSLLLAKETYSEY
ncbi:MAG: ROK family protein [Tissierella sp.]|uniref:ROK family protein n=1 Tax=Tissierella sp. TaxID=41274 RepID=UPI003F996929